MKSCRCSIPGKKRCCCLIRGHSPPTHHHDRRPCSHELFDRAAVERLNALGDHARQTIREAIAEVGVGACVTGGGSLLRIHLEPENPANYRTAYMSADEASSVGFAVDQLWDNRIMVIHAPTGTHHYFSAPHGMAR